MTALGDLPPVKVEIKSEKKEVRLIVESKTDEFSVCQTKIISKSELLGLKKRKLLVHRIEGEEGWEIKIV